MGSDSKRGSQIDVYLDTPVRLLGYANEVGESFRALIHVNVVRLSYGLAFGYVFADTVDKTKKAKGEKKTITAIDTLLWQVLASVAIPGYTINRVCALSLYLFKRSNRLSPSMQKWTTTAIGLSSIPFIVKPIDKMVDVFMDKTFRTYFPPEPAAEQTNH